MKRLSCSLAAATRGSPTPPSGLLVPDTGLGRGPPARGRLTDGEPGSEDQDPLSSRPQRHRRRLPHRGARGTAGEVRDFLIATQRRPRRRWCWAGRPTRRRAGGRRRRRCASSRRRACWSRPCPARRRCSDTSPWPGPAPGATPSGVPGPLVRLNRKAATWRCRRAGPTTRSGSSWPPATGRTRPSSSSGTRAVGAAGPGGPPGTSPPRRLRVLPARRRARGGRLVAAAVALVRGDLPGCDKNLLRAR